MELPRPVQFREDLYIGFYLDLSASLVMVSRHSISTTELSRELGSGRTRVKGLGSCSGRSRRPPILKRFASESAERIAGNEMALDVERVLDCGMNGREPLW